MGAPQTTTPSDSPWDDPRWFRQVAADVTAMLLRLYGAHQLDVVEDAVQDAFVAAVRTWPHGGVPDNAAGWLLTTARNRLRDGWRRDQRALESDASTLAPERATAELSDLTPLGDDQVQLLFACCHPALSPESRVALTLKTVAQLSVEEIARALHADPRAIAQRLVRAKKSLRDARAEWRMPEPADLPARLEDVLSVCYAMFSEGHSATEGAVVVRTDLCQEAIRLLERLATWPGTATPETHALLALCCFAAARVPARRDELWIALADQDRSRWDRGLIRRGLRAFDRAAQGDHLSRYHVEAEIAALHSLAPSYAETPWEAIVSAYDRLLHIAPTRAAALSRALAIAEAGRVDDAWTALDALQGDDGGEWVNWLVARAELAERRGDIPTARASVTRALSLSLPEPSRRYLLQREQHLTTHPSDP
jgi:RNA polymerase sigma-70 factor (ECF subfamily)